MIRVKNGDVLFLGDGKEVDLYAVVENAETGEFYVINGQWHGYLKPSGILVDYTQEFHECKVMLKAHPPRGLDYNEAIEWASHYLGWRKYLLWPAYLKEMWCRLKRACEAFRKSWYNIKESEDDDIPF